MIDHDAKPSPSPLPAWRLSRATRHVDARLAGPITVAELAAETGLSTGHFSRAFRATTGMTAKAYILVRRIERAKHLLQDDLLGLARVAQICGFADQSHFTRTFRRSVGVPPGRWRRHIVPASRSRRFTGFHVCERAGEPPRV